MTTPPYLFKICFPNFTSSINHVNRQKMLWDQLVELALTFSLDILNTFAQSSSKFYSSL